MDENPYALASRHRSRIMQRPILCLAVAFMLNGKGVGSLFS